MLWVSTAQIAVSDHLQVMVEKRIAKQLELATFYGNGDGESGSDSWQGAIGCAFEESVALLSASMGIFMCRTACKFRREETGRWLHNPCASRTIRKKEITKVWPLRNRRRKEA